MGNDHTKIEECMPDTVRCTKNIGTHVVHYHVEGEEVILRFPEDIIKMQDTIAKLREEIEELKRTKK